MSRFGGLYRLTQLPARPVLSGTLAARVRYNTTSTTSQAQNAQAQQTTTSQLGTAVSDTVTSLTDVFRKAAEFINSTTYDGTEEKGLRMLVFGKPGSGKGTLSARLVRDYDIFFVSTGDVLRKEIAAKSEVGRQAETVVASGGLVSDELMLRLIKTELDRLKNKSWIIDGFPRTLHQGELLDKVLNDEGRGLNMVVHLDVPDGVIMGRIAARWVHLPSGRVYNTTYSAPKVAGKDDVTGEPLSKRPDDTPETFSKRLRAYYESTAPLLEYFEDNYPESLHSITGSSSDEVLFASRLDGSSASENDRSDDVSSARPSSRSPFASSATPNTAQNLTLDKLWPQLVNLIEPFNLRRRTHKEEEKVDDGKVREEADDLKDKRVVDVGGKNVVTE